MWVFQKSMAKYHCNQRKAVQANLVRATTAILPKYSIKRKRFPKITAFAGSDIKSY